MEINTKIQSVAQSGIQRDRQHDTSIPVFMQYLLCMCPPGLAVWDGQKTWLSIFYGAMQSYIDIIFRFVKFTHATAKRSGQYSFLKLSSSSCMVDYIVCVFVCLKVNNPLPSSDDWFSGFLHKITRCLWSELLFFSAHIFSPIHLKNFTCIH